MLWPPGPSIPHREDVRVSFGLRQRAHQVDMEMAKMSVWRGNSLKRSFDVSDDLAPLAVEAAMMGLER